MFEDGRVHEFLKAYLLYWSEASRWFRATADAIFVIPKPEKPLMVNFIPPQLNHGFSNIRQTVSCESRLPSQTLDAHQFLLYSGLGIKIAPLLRTLEGNDKEHQVCLVAFSAHGKLIVLGSFNETIRIWDTAWTRAQQTPFNHREVE